jgi:RNA polymerase sigma-70 factor (ECF subfamily)
MTRPAPEPDSERTSEAEAWEQRIRQGDRSALAALYGAHRDLLRRWVEHRLDPRMRGRLSASDVLQEVYLAAEQRLEHFRELPDMPFSVWIRLLAGQRVIDAHRRHLGAEARDAGREVALDRGGATTSAANLAERLAGDFSSPSQAAMRHELAEQLARAIEAMDPLDRDVLELRHFDELSNDEVARLLAIPKGTASKRYVRALGRLRTILERIPGLLDGSG